VDEGVASLEDTDRGAKIGLRWSRGPFEIMNKIGIDKTHAVVKAIAERHPDFKMPQILERQKQAGKPFTFTVVDLAVEGDIARITLNRPEAMNALNETVVRQLEERFSEAENDSAVKAIVFEGAGKAFVAGADIRYFVQKIKAGRIDDIVAFTRAGHELFLRIENSAKLTVAVLDGLSLGGGSELALACQAIVATPAGSMGFPETGIGIYPGLGGMLRLARQVGPELAKYYVFTGAPISAADAHALGVVTRLVAPAEVEGAVRSLLAEGAPDKYRPREIPEHLKPLQKICSPENASRILAGQAPEGVDDPLATKTLKTIGHKAPLALRMTDGIVDRQAEAATIREAIEIELDRLGDIFATADALEGLSSVGRKRPEYRGA
jgi:enoyl-CoA hydratase/3-hydroxyacyl-CoA dehydrogenase